jgi:phosphoribosyl 1,2-cyclic phosphodiesterase
MVVAAECSSAETRQVSLRSSHGCAGGTGWLPEWQLLPGVRLVVDKFGPKTRGLPATAWFLTHFHADHYGGAWAPDPVTGIHFAQCCLLQSCRAQT